MADFKPSNARPRPLVRAVAVCILAVLALVGAGFLGRFSASDPKPAAVPPPGIRYVDGVPTGFARTTRGAGDASAWMETLISVAGSWPHDQALALITRLVDPQVRALVDQLMPSTGREANPNVSQTVVVRVWARPGGPTGDLPTGSLVNVKTYGVGLFGARTDGVVAGPNAGLAGGFSVHDMTLLLGPDGWLLHAVETPVPAPPPDLRGLARDGGPRNTQLLAEVLGPDSWVPNMP